MKLTNRNQELIATSPELYSLLERHTRQCAASHWGQRELKRNGFLQPLTEVLVEELSKEGNTKVLRELIALPASELCAYL
jgi:hypothetical protein